MAAVCAGQVMYPEVGTADILVLEKKELPGRKLSATGNGKCNLSNLKCPDCTETLKIFSDMGLMTRTDSEGRVYPYSEDARDVTEILVREAERYGAEIRTRSEVRGIEPAENGFCIRVNSESRGEYTMLAESVLLASGGKSYPAYGTTGDGFVFARELGHRVSSPRPVLTSVDTREDIKALGLSGLRVKGQVTLLKNGEPQAVEQGEIQFTDRGVSGICVMNMTRYMDAGPGRDLSAYRLTLDLIPEMTEKRIEESLAERASRGYTEQESLRSLIKAPLAKVIAERALSDAGPARQIKGFTLTPKDLGGWTKAQVTRGGVVLEEIDPETMESRLHPGLYFSGEVIDRDGPCGGYNLQNAWTTGIRAGRAMAKR